MRGAFPGGTVCMSAASKACQQLVKHVQQSAAAAGHALLAADSKACPAVQQSAARVRGAFPGGNACQQLVKHVSS
jgi:hypothetical protein